MVLDSKKRPSISLTQSLLLCVFLTLSTHVRLAHAFDVSAVGTVCFSRPSLEINGGTFHGIGSKAGYGGGFLFSTPVSPNFAIELGVLDVRRDFSYPISGGTGEDAFNTIELPLLLDWLPQHWIRFGGGPYAAVPIGQDTYSVTPLGQSTASSLTAAAENFKTDFGLMASLAVKVPIKTRGSFLVDGRYAFGLVNSTRIVGESMKYRAIEVMTGLSFKY